MTKSSENILSSDELNRYSRQIRLHEIGMDGQLKIKNSSVLVVGAGGLGCPVLQYLTASGVGTLGIVDNDCVDVTNLQRQVLYTVNDIAKPKPLAAKEKLELLNPEVIFKSYFLRLNNETALKIINEYDIVVDCTDNFASRYLINDACAILNKPFVYGAISRFSGQVMVLNYHGGPTLRCIYPIPPNPLQIPSCAESGVIGSLAGIIGSMQAIEVIKVVLKSNHVLTGKMFFIDSLSFVSQLFSFDRNPETPIITELGDYDDVCLSENNLINEISTQELRSVLLSSPDLKVIDLRDETENSDIGFECIRIPSYEIGQNLNLIPDEGPVVFYCKYGIKSMIVINYLRKYHNRDNMFSLVL